MTLSEEANEKDEIILSENEVGTKAKSDIEDFRDTQFQHSPVLATDLHLELEIIYHRASLKLLQRNAGKIHCHKNRYTKVEMFENSIFCLACVTVCAHVNVFLTV